MLVNSGGSNNFLIGVDVQVDKATRQIVDLTTKTTQGAREAEAALEAMGNEAEQAGRQVSTGADAARQSTERVATASRTTSAATNTMANSFRGAGAAVSGVSAAMASFGGPVGPIATVGSSLAALAVSGAGPLALAVTGLVALAGAFAYVSNEASEAESEIEAVEASIARLNLETRATRSGRGAREQELVEEITRLRRAVGTDIFGETITVAREEGKESVEKLRLLERELQAIRRLKSAREEEKEQARQSAEATEQSRINIEKIIEAVQNASRGTGPRDRAEIEAQQAEERTAYRARRAAERRAIAAGVAARATARAGLLDPSAASLARQRAAVDLAQTDLDLDRNVRGNVRDEQRIGLEQQLRTEQEILRVVEAQVELRRRENEEQRKAQEEARQAQLRSEEQAHFDKLRRMEQQREDRRQAAIDRNRKATEDAAEQERRALQARFQAPGVAFASGLEQGLSQALSGQLDDPLQRLGSLVQQTMTDAVAAGVIEGLGVKQAAANLTEGISSFISGGLGGPTSAPAGAR